MYVITLQKQTNKQTLCLNKEQRLSLALQSRTKPALHSCFPDLPPTPVSSHSPNSSIHWSQILSQIPSIYCPFSRVILPQVCVAYSLSCASANCLVLQDNFLAMMD